jgi:pimeloyl-ACP methyl ester carboxylesterase
MAAGHKFTDAVHHVVLGVAILLVGLVVVERQLPVQDLLELEELPPKVQAWRQKGELVDIYGNKMFVVQAGQDKSLDVDDVIVFFHGFPTSSFDYDKSLPDLIKEFPKKKLVFFDHIGFGFSDKPQEDYEFTLHDHAENALALMRQLKIKSAHIVAHDMGDSVLTEILLRRHLKLLPDYFNTFFKVSCLYVHSSSA